MAMEELHMLQPKIFRDISPSMMKELTVDKRLACFRTALESCRDSWIEKESLSKLKKEESERLENFSLDQLVDVVVLTLDCVIKAVRELFDPMGEEREWKDNCSSKKPGDPEKTSSLDQNNANGGLNAKENITVNDSNTRLVHNTKEEVKTNARDDGGKSPVTPSKAPLPSSRMPSTPPPPPPPSMTGSGPPMPPPVKGGGARAPPPPPPGAGKMMQKKANKLRRSTQMSSLFQNAQKKMEGTLSGGKSANAVKKQQLGGSAGGDRGLDAALAEMAKRSPYAQQIEEDYKNHAKSIMELKVSITSFQTKDMFVLIKFQKHVESILGCLTDENQVLSKFEDFPAKKLETIRAAAALHSKLDGIVADVKQKEIAAPLERLLEKLEPYFSKLKKEIDAIDRIKDEELAKFKSQGIQFDFDNITKIKELMVDISSSCMELALKERREAKEVMEDEKGRFTTDRQKKGSVEMIWRTFQFAFRIYLFAGGTDDRADKLAKELANEIMGQDS